MSEFEHDEDWDEGGGNDADGWEPIEEHDDPDHDVAGSDDEAG